MVLVLVPNFSQKYICEINKIGAPKNLWPIFLMIMILFPAEPSWKNNQGKTGPVMYNLIKILIKHLVIILPYT